MYRINMTYIIVQYFVNILLISNILFTINAMCKISYANMHDNVVGYSESASRNSMLLHNTKEADSNNLSIRRDLDLQISLLFLHLE